jgi:hypothetical protein
LGDINSAPLKNRKPRISTLGFSFTPPPGIDWLEEFGDSSIKYVKKMNPSLGTFYGMANEFQTNEKFATPDSFKDWITKKEIPAMSLPVILQTRPAICWKKTYPLFVSGTRKNTKIKRQRISSVIHS